jgi:hypothetical protein
VGRPKLKPRSLRRQDAFRVELDALEGKRLVADAHDLAFRCPGRHLESVGNFVAARDERVIATRAKRIRKIRVEPAPVVQHVGGLAVHQPLGTHDGAAVDLDHRLVAQADPEHGDRSREGADHLLRHARLRRHAGTGRDAQVRRLDPPCLVHHDRVVAMHAHVGAEHEEGLHQVVSEGVVIVDQQEPGPGRGRAHVSGPESGSLR